MPSAPLPAAANCALENTVQSCTLLPWDTEFFGVRIARLHDRFLKEDVLEAAMLWCRDQEIDCLYHLADSDQPETSWMLETNGFHMVDIRMTFDANVERRNPSATPDLAVIDFCKEKDLPTLRSIAAQSHHDTRFYSDPNFNKNRSDALYETWIEKSYHDDDTHVFVASSRQGPVGYITCNLTSDGGQIGLIAVDAKARGQGLGRALVARSLDWFASRGVQQVRVVTQGKNIAAQRLYQQLGFLTSSVELWYHKWFPRQTIV